MKELYETWHEGFNFTVLATFTNCVLYHTRFSCKSVKRNHRHKSRKLLLAFIKMINSMLKKDYFSQKM
ncbi:hypothetical protein HOLleu_41121 [Holothuria leucospilota]|uniref:Uncharacterized protein n=1 Tax=Holothuria leucospilota TaxID=206669 RepID=A0A9Q0YBG2_HOLLE|nr:hypothetical protein HOLleu_41121 [Holothuria leucospilota]